MQFVNIPGALSMSLLEKVKLLEITGGPKSKFETISLFNRLSFFDSTVNYVSTWCVESGKREEQQPREVVVSNRTLDPRKTFPSPLSLSFSKNPTKSRSPYKLQHSTELNAVDYL